MLAFRHIIAAFTGWLLLTELGLADEPKKPEAAKNSDAVKKDLRKLAIAIHDYEVAYGHMPPAAIRDKNGKPLLSWRVLALPYVGEGKLYKEFHFDEPWDSDHNKKLIAQMPAIFRGPNKKLNEQYKTAYLAPVEPSTVFPPDGSHVKLSNLYDGTSNTIMLVEANDDAAVIWTRPDDLRVDLAKPFRGLEQPGDGFFMVVMCDGWVMRLTSLGDPRDMESALARDDGQVLNLGALEKPYSPATFVAGNLLRIGYKMRNYQWKRFPHAALRDLKGNPLLSWRVELLREIGAVRLYQEFHLDEAWDSEHNKKLIARMPLVYQGLNPKLNAAGKTTILVPVGKATMFPPDGKRIRLEDIHNDVATTIMTLQVNDDSAVIWTKPDDLNVDLSKPLHGLAQPGQDFFRALMADGNVRQFRLKINPAKVAAMFNIASGKTVEIKPEDEVPMEPQRMK